MTEKDLLIIQAKVCPYCGGTPKLIDSSEVYGRSYGLMYICKPCDAYVGCHRGTKKPLGRLANKQLREAKMLAHQYFDQIAKTELINEVYPVWIPNVNNRNKAYRWLSKKMKIDKKFCHIGMFTEEQCMKVVDICRPVLLGED